ncbi:MAG: DUF3105 domain-containing protein [Acidimicrobiia bacterium]|nr:DUF3105 domain-containing protein [Acidimicrobiia bacterium]NNF55595.1 DUF3105 domain-containing protein [Acidimicrobiales bacterium]NNL98811.1 DUF3105 domain-containing protein [Acidimicrobiia bacterium]
MSRKDPLGRQIDWKRVGVWVGSMAVVAGLTAVVVSGVDPAAGGRPEAPEGTETVAVEDPIHVPGGVDYPVVPPAGGEHDPTPLACGFYDFVVPDENVVHSLEHGVVWVTYEPGASAEELKILKDIGEARETIVSLLPDQGSSVIGTAWAAQIRLDSATDPRLEQFVDAFRDAPSSPEPLASCAGGVVPSRP